MCRSAVLACILGCVATQGQSAFAYVTFGQGFSSKWGADPAFGTGAVVTWGFMLDGTSADPSLPAYPELLGTSQIGTLRTSIDTTYGAGAFDAAIQRAFDTVAAAANIRFIGPLADSGMPAGQQGATSPDIRIGAFHAVPQSGFSFVGAIGYGPPGIITPANDFPESGDIFFNLDAAFQIAAGSEDLTPIQWWQGNDLEGLFLHELGHAALGLGHPPWANENPDQRVMYVGDWTNPDAPWCCETINRQFHPDDIAGAQYVYGIAGDFHRDGRVDAADYVGWRKTNGHSVTPGSGADANIDGVVNGADYDSWWANYGNVALQGFGEQFWGVGAVAVPEGQSLLLCLLLAAPWITREGLRSRVLRSLQNR